jgi:hypothetical protein
VDRQEIIAALDTEIVRLQHARLLIAQSGVHGWPSKRTPLHPPSKKSRKGTLSAATREPIARTPREGGTQLENEAAIPFTRIPAKGARRQRAPRAVAKHENALTANVPTGPVAAPGKKSKEAAAGSEADLPAIASSTSAFGQAIARELAALDG